MSTDPNSNPDGSNAPTSSVEPPPALLAALRRILRPIVRTLIRHGITFPFFSSFLKGLFVEIADEEFPIAGKRPTVSRTALLTGVHRKDVKRLREEASREAATPTAITLGAQILSRWITEPPWLDEAGQPRPLPRMPETGREGSDFQALVRSVSVDIHPRSILDEWVRLGVADVDDDDHVVLRAAGFVPARGFDEKAHFIGRNLRDHLQAAFENLDAEESPHLERSVHYAEVPASRFAALDALARELGQSALETFNREAKAARDEAARAAETSNEEATPENLRINFGVYFFHEDATIDTDAAGSAESGSDATHDPAARGDDD